MIPSFSEEPSNLGKLFFQVGKEVLHLSEELSTPEGKVNALAKKFIPLFQRSITSPFIPEQIEQLDSLYPYLSFFFISGFLVELHLIRLFYLSPIRKHQVRVFMSILEKKKTKL